jgi:PEGA domain
MQHQGPIAVVLVFACLAVNAQQPQAPPATAANPDSQSHPVQESRPPQPHTLLDGTPVKLRLAQTMSSADARVGQEVPFEVVEEVKVDDVVVLPKGATAIGTVTDCNAKKSMGRAGKLDMSISYARLADNEKAALRAVQDAKGGGHVGAMTGAMVATAIVFFPAAPLFLFMHGKDITIPQGTEITAFVEGDMHLDMARFGVAPPAPPAPVQASTAVASISIDSTPPGADIEIDGGFVGNTPSAVNVAPGPHEISIKKKGFAEWSRKLTVTGGAIHLNAELDATPASRPESAPVAAPAPAQSPQTTPVPASPPQP